MGFFDISNSQPKKKEVDECHQFVIKDKFTYITGGREQLYLVDKQDTIHFIWDDRAIKNVYIYKSSRIGDEIQLKIMKWEDGSHKSQVLDNITKTPSLKVNILDLYNGVKND